MAKFSEFLSRLSGAGNNVRPVDDARTLLQGPSFDSLLASDAEVAAVKELRKQVPGLSLVDALFLVREAREKR